MSVVSEDSPTAADLIFYASPFTEQPQTIAKGVQFTQLTAGQKADGYSGIFLYNNGWAHGERNLSYMDCSAQKPSLAEIDIVYD
ncbi:MAG: hypothetical protein H8E40_05005 [Chloroflexi bacterium]|nr:hypothetical protein [Chloroflexota bacterium]